MAYSFLVFLLRSPVLKMLISNPAIPLFYIFLFAFMKFSSENREFAKMLCPVFTYIIGSNYSIFTFAPAKWAWLYFFHIALSPSQILISTNYLHPKPEVESLPFSLHQKFRSHPHMGVSHFLPSKRKFL